MRKAKVNGSIPMWKHINKDAVIKRYPKQHVTVEEEKSHEGENGAEHIEDNTWYSLDTEYTCIWLGTHTGKPGDGLYVEDGTHASSKEATDNSTDEPKTNVGK